MSIDYRILGPLEVIVDGRVVPVTSSRQRALLAPLLADTLRAAAEAGEPAARQRIPDG
jgi:DNA-binding SARP family transcriptional activator